jgi:hypothetical protein
MKRQRHKAATKKKHQPRGAAPPATSRRRISRRDLIQTIVYSAIGGTVIGGASWYFVMGVQASIVEGDLSQIGNGIPAVVQIHDPQCPRCRALQRTTRDAISEMEVGSIQFLVANIRSPEGRQFATAHGVGHVTLLLFDGSGRRREVLVGERTSEHLLEIFMRLSRATR